MTATGFKLFCIRVVIVVVLPLMLVWTVLNRVWIEVRTIPLYVRNDLSDEWGSARLMWNGKLPKVKD